MAIGRQFWTGRAVASIVLFAGLAGAFVACGGSDANREEAERVAVRWLKAMEVPNLKAACQLMDAENHSSPAEFPNWDPAKSCQERWLHSDNTPLGWKPKPNTVSIWGEEHPRVLNVEVEADKATVYVEGVGGDERPVWLRKEHGRWLVDDASYPI